MPYHFIRTAVGTVNPHLNPTQGRRQMASFKAWLNGHRHAQTAIGDLARDAAQDPNWPRTSSLKRLVAHLEEMGAIDRAIDTLRRAHQEYETDKSASPS